MKTILTLGIIAIGLTAFGQNPKQPDKVSNTASNHQPFLFSATTLTPNDKNWLISYAGSYGNNATNPLGFNGVDQQFAVKGFLGSKFTLFANASIGFNQSGGTTSMQQLEVIRDIIGGNKAMGFRFGLGLGALKEWTNDKATFTRLVVEWDNSKWKIASNMRFEKSFAENRDGIDLISSAGILHKFSPVFYAGAEAVGEDLEGFWDKEEAEGGAKLFLGPSLNYLPSNSRLSFAVSGGPIIYATQNQQTIGIPNRDLNSQIKNGFTVRAQAVFRLKK